MGKLFALIFLSLAVSCGERIESSGPDPVVERNFSATEEAPRDDAWESVDFQLEQIWDVATQANVKAASPMQFAEDSFYAQFKTQYKSQAPQVEIISSQWTWIIPVNKKSDVYMATLNIQQYQRLASLSIKFFDIEDPKNLIIRNFQSPFREKLDMELRLADFPKLPGKLAIKVEDFILADGAGLKEGLAEKLNSRYALSIEQEGHRETLYPKAGVSLKQALLKAGYQLETDTRGEISSFMQTSNASLEVDINNYPDETTFWRLLNAQGQSLNYRPFAGQRLALKKFTMGDLRERVAKRTSRRISGKGRKIEIKDNPQRFSWKLKKLKLTKIEPIVKTELRNAVCINCGALIKNCQFAELKLERKQSLATLKQALGAKFPDAIKLIGGELHVHGSDVVHLAGAKVKSLSVGAEARSCGLKKKGTAIDQATNKAYKKFSKKTVKESEEYLYEAELVEVFRL